MSVAATTFLPFITWMFLPGVATKLLLNILYSNRILTLPQTPSQSELHTRRIRTLLIVSYLVYTIYASLFLRPINFYELLNVDTDSDGEAIRRSFRKLARIYHPDKMGGGPKNELLFIELRKAHDCLVEPVKRATYDRFGSDVLELKEAITLREHFAKGIESCVAYHLINTAVYAFVRWINGQSMITFWHLSLFSLLLSLELRLILSPGPSSLMAFLPSQTTHFDVISALRTSFVAFTLASNHIYNLLPTLKGEMAQWQQAGLLDKDIKGIRQELQGFRLAITQLRDQWRDIQVEADRALAFDLLPLRPTARESVQTVQEAASIAAGQQTSTTRKPNAAEETYIHLLGRLILRAKVSGLPAVQALRRAEAQTSATSVAADEDKEGKEEVKESQTEVEGEDG